MAAGRDGPGRVAGRGSQARKRIERVDEAETVGGNTKTVGVAVIFLAAESSTGPATNLP